MLNGPVLVTGGAGFIGQHLARTLVESGLRPRVLVRRRQADPDTEAWQREVGWRAGDLRNPSVIAELFDIDPPQTVIHLAGTRGGAGSSGAEACFELNVLATTRLLRAATIAGTCRIVMVGSAEEYGPQSGPLAERTPRDPASPYGISRAAAVRLAGWMHREEGCPVVILRPFTVYGPGQPVAMFVAQAVRSAVGGLPFAMSEGSQKRDLVYVTDVVRALIAGATVPDIEGETINIGSGQATSLRAVAERIWETAGASGAPGFGARPARPEELYDTWADITLARRLLKWEPRVDLEQGIRQTVRHSIEQEGRRARECRMKVGPSSLLADDSP